MGKRAGWAAGQLHGRSPAVSTLRYELLDWLLPSVKHISVCVLKEFRNIPIHLRFEYSSLCLVLGFESGWFAN